MATSKSSKPKTTSSRPAARSAPARARSAAAAEGQAQNCAVINPYALAELVAGQSIPWNDLPDPQRVLEQVLATPYEELFDPKFGGPLYVGMTLDADLKLVPQRSPLLDLQPRGEGNDAVGGGLESIDQYATLAELAKAGVLKSILDWPILCADLSRAARLQVTLQLPPALRDL